MTEEKRISTVQPEQIQGFNSPAEDELSLIDLLKFLARKKVFILAVTSVCVISAIFYAQSITPIYRATVGLLDHNESFSSFSILEQLDPELADKANNQTIKSLTIFERFLFNIKSSEFKQEVFMNGGFQKKFSRETGIGKDQHGFSTSSVAAIYDSTKLVKGSPGDVGTTFLALEGSQPKVMLEFLTALIQAAKENVNTEINNIQRSTIKSRINNLSTQIEELHQEFTVQKEVEKEKKAMQKQIVAVQEQIEKEKIVMEIEELHQKITEQEQIEKEKVAIEIARFSNALAIAKHMGQKNNNINNPDSVRFPLWFRYGELALQEEIKILRSKEKEIPNTENLSREKLKLKKLQQEITSLRSKKEEIPNTKKLPIEKATIKLKAKLKLKRLQREITNLRSKEKEISKTKNLSIEKLKLERSQTSDLPLLKFKVATISKHNYSLVKPYLTSMIIGFGVAFGLFISIFMAFLIDSKQLRA